MKKNVAQKLIASHLEVGVMNPGESIGIKIEQTLTQDATGTLVMLEFEALNLPRVKTEVSVQYVDHNLIQEDYKNPDDHVFLKSACRKFGVWYSQAGNGVSHPVHQERFGKPGKTMVGSDSHTPAAGSIGMLALGAGGLEVAMAMAGEPLYINMPKIVGVRLEGELPDWVSAKDVILELLRRFDVKGGVGKIYEYYGPGLKSLTAMDRHVIANMGTELGATTTVFPSDNEVKRFLRQQQREGDWEELTADEGAEYDEDVVIELDKLEPMIALPSSPGNVRLVREVAGEPIYQAYIGSSANPGLRDFAVPALMVENRFIPSGISFDVNPTSRQMLEILVSESYLGRLIRCGARIHQAGCNGCIGMGQAPATGSNSLRTVPRNFPGRSGTKEDRVFLCSPETATASALRGKITDPRDMEMDYPKFVEPETVNVNMNMLLAPAEENLSIELEKGPNLKSLPELDPPPEKIKAPILLKLGDNISTDEIMPAGSRILPFRSNIPEISRFVFEAVDEKFAERAEEHKDTGFFLVGGENYGQGSSREHAALAPRYLGLHAVLAKSYARIHWQNLVNFGILPLCFINPDDYDALGQKDTLELEYPLNQIEKGEEVRIKVSGKDLEIKTRHELSKRQIEMIRHGSLIGLLREKKGE